MPRRKLARRFEPRYGVSQSMVETEVKWVQRELEDHLLLSITDLRKRLSEIGNKVSLAEQSLRSSLNRLPDRERLALKCMLARDIFHIAALYETSLRSTRAVEEATGTSVPTAEEKDANDEPQPVLVFSESLFT